MEIEKILQSIIDDAELKNSTHGGAMESVKWNLSDFTLKFSCYFAEWFMPNWRFYDLGEWENASNGEIKTTRELLKEFLKTYTYKG